MGSIEAIEHEKRKIKSDKVKIKSNTFRRRGMCPNGMLK